MYIYQIEIPIIHQIYSGDTLQKCRSQLADFLSAICDNYTIYDVNYKKALSSENTLDKVVVPGSYIIVPDGRMMESFSFRVRKKVIAVGGKKSNENEQLHIGKKPRAEVV